MKQFTVSQSFILEAHKVACSSWKQRLENEFPEAFVNVCLRKVVQIEKHPENDTRKKEFNLSLGMTGKVTDGSYNKDLVTGQERSGVDKLFDNQCEIVGFTDEMWIEGVIGWQVTMNLILRFKNGTVIYCAPCCFTTSNDLR